MMELILFIFLSNILLSINAFVFPSSLCGNHIQSITTTSSTSTTTKVYARDVLDHWDEYFQKSHITRYQIIASPGMEDMAESLQLQYPLRFKYHKTSWNKFPDGTDKIEIGGFSPQNYISGEHILMLTSFHNNDVTLSQFSVMITLLQSFIESLTVVLPFYPVGTMERVIKEGQVATANTYAVSYLYYVFDIVYII